MSNISETWHYLIVTAANQQQAAAYEAQIRARRETGQLPEVRETLVVADPEGRRVGSGGSTLECLLHVLRHESAAAPLGSFEAAESVLRRLRILIVHAGGDSRRLPAYSPCGKIFIPLPGETQSAHTPTLFDRLVPTFLALPASAQGAGQIVVTSGDALIRFNPSEVTVVHEGMMALGSLASPEEAARHGVFCRNSDGSVRLYLQKPDLGRQAETGAINADGKSVLDIGVMSLDASAAMRLLRAFCAPSHGDAGITWTPEAWHILLTHGIDLYREICAALGTDTTWEHYLNTVRASGSKLHESVLSKVFSELRTIPLHLQLLSHSSFLHFGSTSQLISSGLELAAEDTGAAPADNTLAINNLIHDEARIDATEAWVEGCRLSAPILLEGSNVVVGVDVADPFELPEGACLDVSQGFDRDRKRVWFIRYCNVTDTFKHSVAGGATFCGKPLAEWLRSASIPESEVWSADTPNSERTLWNARVFPAEREHSGYLEWRWMLDAENATTGQKRRFLAADRYSSAEIAVRVDQDAFHTRRAAIRAVQIQKSLGALLRADSAFRPRDLAFALRNADDRAAMVTDVLTFAHGAVECDATDVAAPEVFSRALRFLGIAVSELAEDDRDLLDSVVPGLPAVLPGDLLAWMDSAGIALAPRIRARDWARRLPSLVTK